MPTRVGLMARYFTGVTLNLQEWDPGVLNLVGKRVVVETRPRMPCQRDGETAGHTPLTCEIRPRSLRLLVPQATPRALFGQRQADQETRAAAGCAFDQDVTRHALDEILDDGQAQARPGDSVGAPAEEGIENPRDMLRFHADSGIGNLDQRLAIGLADPGCQRAAVGHRVVRVLHQVEEDHADLGFVGQHPQLRRADFDLLADVAALGVELEQSQGCLLYTSRCV